jgi:hypothetical protein
MKGKIVLRTILFPAGENVVNQNHTETEENEGLGGTGERKGGWGNGSKKEKQLRMYRTV